MYQFYAVLSAVGIFIIFAGLVVMVVGGVMHRGPIRGRWGLVLQAIGLVCFLYGMISASSIQPHRLSGLEAPQQVTQAAASWWAIE